jgi:predicted dienelactone hydrolase
MRAIWIVAITACTPATPASPPAAQVTTAGVGFRTLTAVDPIAHGELPIAVFYPAMVAGHASVGPYELAAGAGAPIAPGRWPLIALSHGHAGSMWGHHDLAEALARNGFVVAAVEHVGDSYRGSDQFRSDRIAFGRASQLSATIDAVLADPDLAPHVDGSRIGVAGFSAGGWTSLLMVGAHPDLTRIAPYCARHPEDRDLCGGPIQIDLAAPPRTADPRVRAAFVMAPFAVPFGAGSFGDVRAPIYLTWGTADHVLPPDENAARIAAALPSLVAQQPIAGADHFVFLSPCSAELAREAPMLCTDPEGIDRVQVHDQLATAAVAFFRNQLR